MAIKGQLKQVFDNEWYFKEVKQKNIFEIHDINFRKNKVEKKGGVRGIYSNSEDIICISSTRWDFLWQRPHHLMDRLSKRNKRVLFFNHSVPMNYQEIEDILAEPELWNNRLKKASDKLWVFSPVHLEEEQISYLPAAGSINSYNYKLKESVLKFLLKKLQFREPVIITYLAESINYLKNISRKLLCYDCVDDFSAFSWAKKDDQYNEKALIKEADLVITTADELFKQIKKTNSKTFLLPNAVEYEHFASSIHKRQFGVKNLPVIGFIGAFYEWVDEQLIEYLARKKKDWCFHFIGPVQPGMAANIIELPNVKFFGTRKYKSLPKFLEQMDVCIIPFKLNKITRSANPIKLWEYMASGRPIVSTPIPEVKKYAEVVYIGETKEKFLLKMEEALKEDSINKRTCRTVIAQKNDWSCRVDGLVRIINDALEEKKVSDLS